MLRVPDMGAVRNPEAYLYTVASNLAKEHVRDEFGAEAALDVDDPLVQAQLAELPMLGGQLDAERRIKRLREVTRAITAEVPRRRRIAVLAGLELSGNSRAVGKSRPTWSRISEAGVDHCRRRMVGWSEVDEFTG